MNNSSKTKFFFKKTLFIFIFLLPIFCIADENSLYLDNWKTIIEGTEDLDQSDGKDWKLSNEIKTFNEFEGKKILSFIREGDYTHAGEEEALDLIMALFPKDKNRKILDVACGLGASAAYFHKNDWGNVTGFDIEEEAIQYAKKTYGNISFFISDVANVSEKIKNPDFDLICIVNSLVCFPDQLQSLKELRKLSKSTTKLIIFDYTDLTTGKDNLLVGMGKRASFLPIRIKDFETLVDRAGWKITKYVNLDSKFEIWYKNFLDLVESKRFEIDEKFGKNSTNYVRGKYDLIYYGLKQKWLGGCLIVLSLKDEE
ncbi:MAG: methyltransferase domain-containing protein [Parachlamydiales bacterium]|jgi:SAM-dependent methyltransferase